jgi:tetratricopeptide (TPR) repeat protein
MTDEDPTRREGLSPSPNPKADATKREGAGSLPEVTRVDLASDASHNRLSRGTLVGRYVVLDTLGEGGMGVVYSAFDPELDRKVAIKLLQPGTGGSTSGGDRAWLVREAQALARLSHPNVVAVHDVGTLADDRVFLAMELVEGETLREWLKPTARPWREVLDVMCAAGEGLAAAHAAGLVHRDFKPDNVIVGSDGRVRVMDFGLARLRHDAPEDEAPKRSSDLSIESRSPLSEKLTIAGVVVGTPAYMAPELYAEEAANAGTDQFAFGVAVFEALFRTRPYDKQDLRPPVTVHKPKTPPDVGVPARVQRAVLRAIAIDPAARFPDMRELLAALHVERSPARLVALGVAAVATVAVVIAGAAIAYSHFAQHAPPPCRGIAQRLDGVWDAKARTTTETAFLATKQPFAPKAYAGVARALDAYTGEWTKAVTEACEATRVRGEQTEEVLTLREQCYDERLGEVRGLVTLFADADASMVEKGDKIVFGLEPIARCANIALLRAPGLPPPEHRAQVAELSLQLVQAKAEMIAGRHLKAAVLAQKIIEAANKIGWEPIVAEALSLRGTTLLPSGNFEQAGNDFRAAVFAAIRGKRDDVAADAGISMAMVVSDGNGKPAEAKIWLDHAEAAATRAGFGHTIERRRLEVAGMIAGESGDLNAAVELHEKALAVAIAEMGKDAPELMSDELDLGTSYSRAGAYAKALPHYERALALRTKSVGDEHPDIALVLSNLGAAYNHVGDAKRGRAAFERALAMREKFYGANSPLLVATLDNFAELVRRQGDVGFALQLQERALRLARMVPGPTHPMFHQLATDYGDTLVAAQRYVDARKHFDAVFAMEAAVKSPIVPATQTSRAQLALAERDWKGSVAWAAKAVAGYESAGGANNPMLWKPLTALARGKLGLARPAEARPYLQRALDIAKQAQTPDDDIAPTKDLLAQLPPVK